MAHGEPVYNIDEDKLMPATMELAAKIASKPPIPVRLAKEGLRRSLNMPVEQWKDWHSFAMRHLRRPPGRRPCLRGKA